MKNQHEHIDNIFKRLKEDSFEIPEDFMTDLDARLDQEFPVPAKKRKRIISILLFSVFTIIAFFGIAVYYSQEAENNEQIQLSIAESRSSSEQYDLEAISQLESTNTNHASNSKNGYLSNISSSDDRTAIRILHENKIVQKSKLVIGDNNIKYNDNIELPSSTNGEVTSKGAVSKTSIENNSKGKTKGNKGNLNSTQTFGDNSPTDLSSSSNSSNVSSTNSTNSDISQDSTIDTDNSFSLKEPEVSTLILKQPILEEINHNIEEPTEILPLTVNDNLTKQWELDLQLYGGVSLTSMKVKMNSIDSNFSDINKSTSFSPTFGFKSNVFYKNINASLGLEYYQSKEKFKLKKPELTQTGTDSTFIGVHIDSTYSVVDSMYHYDSTEVYQYTPLFDSVLSDYNVTNNYSWISLPIAFGYRFSINNWDIIPRAGVNLNFGISQNRGEYPGANNSVIHYEAVRFNADFMIQTEVRRNFNTFHVSVSPYFRGNINPFIQSPSFDISHQNWGINFGAGIKF